MLGTKTQANKCRTCFYWHRRILILTGPVIKSHSSKRNLRNRYQLLRVLEVHFYIKTQKCWEVTNNYMIWKFEQYVTGIQFPNWILTLKTSCYSYGLDRKKVLTSTDTKIFMSKIKIKEERLQIITLRRKRRKHQTIESPSIRKTLNVKIVREM